MSEIERTIDALDKEQARELLKAFLIVSTFLDEQREILIDMIRTCQVIELQEMLDLPDMELMK